MEDEGGGYRWETGYEKTWEAITEDGDGLLEVSVQDVIHRARRKRLAERQGRNKLGMMRHLYLLIGLLAFNTLLTVFLKCRLERVHGQPGLEADSVALHPQVVRELHR